MTAKPLVFPILARDRHRRGGRLSAPRNVVTLCAPNAARPGWLGRAVVSLGILALSACGGGGGAVTEAGSNEPSAAAASTAVASPVDSPTAASPVDSPTAASLPVAYRLSDAADVVKPDYVKAMTTLPNGDVVATLIQSDTIVLDPTGKTLAGSGADAGVVVYDAVTGLAKTAFSFGGDAQRVLPHGIAVDMDGSLVVIGYAAAVGRSSVDFGVGPVDFTGGEVPFVARFDATGRLIWAHVLQGSGGSRPENCSDTNCDRAWDVAIASSGDIGIVGGFSGRLTTPAGALQSAGGSDIFVLVLDREGRQKAAWTVGGPGNEGGADGASVSPGGLGEMSIVASQGEWVLQGTFGGATEFRGTGAPSTALGPVNGVRDVFVARYTADGRLNAPVWTAGAVADVSGGLAAPGAMRADAGGTLVLSLRFDSGGRAPGNCSTPTRAGVALHTLSLSPLLACQWATRFDFSGGGIHRTVVDGAGRVYVAGWFGGSHVFPNQTVSARSTRSDIFLARLDGATGAVRWGSGLVSTAAVPASHIPAGLTLDGSGHPWIGGQFFADMELAQTQSGQASTVLRTSFRGAPASLGNDGFVARYDADTGWLR